MGRIRKQLSVAAVRTQADCLITRMSNVGEGAGAAGKRRQKVIRWERRWEKEMQAEMVCERQGSNIKSSEICIFNNLTYTGSFPCKDRAKYYLQLVLHRKD